MQKTIKPKNHADQFVNMDISDSDVQLSVIYNENNKLITKDIIKYSLNADIKNLALYQQALTHKSYCKSSVHVNEINRKNSGKSEFDKILDLQDKSYERLEFLGDSVLHLILGEYLYFRYGNQDEGFLTRLSTKIENSESFANLSLHLNLSDYILLSKNIEIALGRKNRNILEDVFEALFGALYQDLGYQICKNFMIKLVESKIDISQILLCDTNYKDRLLRYYHQQKWTDPVYHELSKTGPSHNRKFSIYVLDENKNKIGVGSESSKKRAEQLAAKDALKTLGILFEENYGENSINQMAYENMLVIEEQERLQKEEKNLEINDASPESDEEHIPLIYNGNNKLITKTDLYKILNHKIKNLKLYQQALTHKSYSRNSLTNELFDKLTQNDNALPLRDSSYERLKFFGSRVLHFVLADYLYYRYPDQDEGFLTRLRTKIENGETVAYLAKEIGLSEFMLISEQIELAHGRDNKKILKESCSAFLGAIYLDLGHDICIEYIKTILEKKIDISQILKHDTNYKDRLLRYYHQRKWPDPQYHELARDGPGHERIFTMYVQDNRKKQIGMGTGSSKKIAAQLAAKEALISLGVKL